MSFTPQSPTTARLRALALILVDLARDTKAQNPTPLTYELAEKAELFLTDVERAASAGAALEYEPVVTEQRHSHFYKGEVRRLRSVIRGLTHGLTAPQRADAAALLARREQGR